MSMHARELHVPLFHRRPVLDPMVLTSDLHQSCCVCTVEKFAAAPTLAAGAAPLQRGY